MIRSSKKEPTDTKDEITARLADVLAELDRTKERLLRSGVPKAAIPLILGASLGASVSGCGADYAAPCDGACDGSSGYGGEGGTVTSTGGSGGAGGAGGS